MYVTWLYDILYVYITFTSSHLADAFKRLTNEDNGSNNNLQKSNNMPVTWQVLVSLTRSKFFYFYQLIQKRTMTLNGF